MLFLLSDVLSKLGRWYDDGEQRKMLSMKAVDKLSSDDAMKMEQDWPIHISG